MKNEQQKGIWIPTEILEDNRLDLTEKVILAIYKYYTIEGELHCCMMTNEQIADIIGISVPTVQRAKRKLKELNLIKTNNGIKVWYKGYQNDTHNNQEQGYQNDTHNNQEQGYQNDTPPHQNDTPEGIKMTPLGYQNDTHNKERKKNKKRNNKESYNLSTLDISDTSDISTSIGTTHNDNFKQEKTMEEKQQQKLTVVQQQKLTVEDEQEMDSRKNTIMASIERFIEKSPELDEEQVKGYIEYYAGKIKEAYHQDDANSTISTMIGRISKARLNNVPTNTPPKWMVEKADNEFKEHSVGNNHIMIGIGAYAQKVNQMLANDRKKPDYRDKVDGYKNWYLQHIIEMAAPALAKKNPDIPMEEIKRKIQVQFQKAF